MWLHNDNADRGWRCGGWGNDLAATVSSARLPKEVDGIERDKKESSALTRTTRSHPMVHHTF